MKHNYNIIPQADSSENIIQHSQRSKYTTRKVLVIRILIFLFLLLVGVAISVSISSRALASRGCAKLPTSPFGTYHTRFNTELLLPPSVISLEVRKFTGNPFFLRNGTEVIQLDPRARAYTGSPSSEIDEAWDELLHGRYFNISEAEAQSLWGDRYTEYRDLHTGGFIGGFDVFHGLHCLNQLRRGLSPEYYPRTFLHGVEHDWHCINHIRQLLQCSSVASIIPSLYRPAINKQYSDAAQPHVCRNWDKIQAYTRQRYNSSGNSSEAIQKDGSKKGSNRVK